MTIKVLGACCKKSLATFDNVKKAVDGMGLKAEVENVGDLGEIASYGVMSTPALVVEDRVVSFGKFLSVEDAREILEKTAR